MSKAKEASKVETVTDPAFVASVQQSIDILGITVVARALQTGSGEVRRIVNTGEIPADIYAYAKTMGFVDQDHSGKG